MTLVFHIGSHKTGTTAIQRFAARHRRALRKRGLWYPAYEDIGLPGHYAHHHFAHAVAGSAGNAISYEEALRFTDHIRRNRQAGETVLLSAEPVYRHLLPDHGDYWSARAAYVAKLKEAIGLDDVTALAVFRRQDHFATSLYQEKVKSRSYSNTFRQFLVSERAEFEYHRQLSMFKDAFATVDVLIYEDLRRHGLIEAFFRHLGIDVSDLPQSPLENVSLPLELVEFKRLLNVSKPRKRRLARVVGKLEQRAAAGGLLDGVNWISCSEMKDFLDSFEEENERLRRAFLNDRPPPVFPSLADVPIEDKDEYRGMSVERFATLTMEILR